MSDLEDDYLGQEAGAHNVDADDLNRQLFGEESDDEQAPAGDGRDAAPEEQILEDEDDGDAEAELEDVLSSEDPDERRGAAKKAGKGSSAKKKREAGGKDDKPKKKRQRTSEGDKGGDRAKRGAKGADKARQRPRRSAGDAGGGRGADIAGADGHSGPVAAGDRSQVLDEDLSEEMKEGDADRAFIDDEGVERGSEDEGEQVIVAEEAEEALDAEEDHPFKRKRKKEQTGNVEHEIKDMLGKMEAAMEHDYETVARNAGVELKKDGSDNLVTDGEGHYVVARKGPPSAAKIPAISKLKLLPEVEDFLAQRKYHESFLQQGGLGVLKGWLEPYHDGTLPNMRVRTTVLKGLQKLPIDTRHEDHKEMLRKSQLGKNVMFLFKCNEETSDNRRIAKELVHSWSRPIFYDQDAEEAKKLLHQQQLLEARRMELERRKDGGEQEGVAAAVARSKAMRIHALIPRASKLDYVNNPGAAKDFNDSEVSAAAAAGPKGKQVDVLTKRLREQQKKLRDGSARAMKPSVEGRNIVLMK
ncbi:hypothetical protein PLESTB_001256100 [Pleodorina starrii]|uniref:TFIIS N-terminal domain-containing protein n=1 Tax=Pleodorina starrii TaxID=330485 RepID=A0A9W6BTC8_9CHLO|nr:hypothetical protein PLESTM_000203800 [Pleodorina starrii]GLC57708.1 hypothetical protein PLESTB_001256100 [Pleodorina starrii]GLC63378.1 hypothetical protein PLESTF_000029900 [Pleodorina starrii]